MDIKAWLTFTSKHSSQHFMNPENPYQVFGTIVCEQCLHVFSQKPSLLETSMSVWENMCVCLGILGK